MRDTNSKSTTRNPKIILLRHFIHLAYKGTNYHGWQSQPNAISVQEVLEKALQIILRKSIAIVAAGRTDAGVHAKEMYAHFDFDEIINVEKLVKKLNSFLPKDIAIFKIIKVHDTAHARFDAVKRTYQYHIHTQKNAFECNDSWYFVQNINIEKMNEACKILFAYTDFECFSKIHTDVNTFDCKIYEAFWQQKENQLVFTIAADRFLRNMVRAIVGTLINIGLEKVSLEDFKKIIESKDRAKAGFSVPAHGLYLTKIEYAYL